MTTNAGADFLAKMESRRKPKPFEFKIGQRFIGRESGSLRTITSVSGPRLDYTISYPARGDDIARETVMWGMSKRTFREMIRGGEVTQIGEGA